MNCENVYYYYLSVKIIVKSMLTGNQMSLHSKQKKNRCQKMESIANVINIIGKYDLSYRRDKAEAAASLKTFLFIIYLT